MKQEIKDRWCKALRSGEYEQGQETLAQVNNGKITYCCLGVLCEILKDELSLEISEYNRSIGSEGSRSCLMFNEEIVVLPEEVAVYAGLDHPCPNVNYTAQSGTIEKTPLSILNDGDRDVQGMNFNQIADLIEEQL